MPFGLQRPYQAGIWLSDKPLGEHHCLPLTPATLSTGRRQGLTKVTNQGLLVTPGTADPLTNPV